jgi:hypothetical protein
MMTMTVLKSAVNRMLFRADEKTVTPYFLASLKSASIGWIFIRPARSSEVCARETARPSSTATAIATPHALHVAVAGRSRRTKKNNIFFLRISLNDAQGRHVRAGCVRVLYVKVPVDSHHSPAFGRRHVTDILRSVMIIRKDFRRGSKSKDLELPEL